MAALSNPITPAAAPSAPPIAIDHAAAWLEPNARIAWQEAVLADRDLSTGAVRQAWRLLLHCIRVPRWPMTVAELGKECRQSRSVAFPAFSDLERYGYARRNGEFLEIIPLGFRPQSGNPDSHSPEIRTPVATAGIAKPRVNAIPRAQVSREQEQKLIQEKRTKTTVAPAESAPIKLPIAQPDVVLHAEELRKELVARKVAPREVAKLLRTIPHEAIRQAIAAGDAYVGRAGHIENRGGIYAAAARRRWKLNKKDRCLGSYRIQPAERPITRRPADPLYQATHCELCSGTGVRMVIEASGFKRFAHCDHKYLTKVNNCGE